MVLQLPLKQLLLPKQNKQYKYRIEQQRREIHLVINAHTNIGIDTKQQQICKHQHRRSKETGVQHTLPHIRKRDLRHEVFYRQQPWQVHRADEHRRRKIVAERRENRRQHYKANAPIEYRPQDSHGTKIVKKGFGKSPTPPK